MNQTPQRESAKIYQFPVGGRAATLARREGQRNVGDASKPRYASVDCGSGWYHDAAIRDAEVSRRG